MSFCLVADKCEISSTRRRRQQQGCSQRLIFICSLLPATELNGQLAVVTLCCQLSCDQSNWQTAVDSYSFDCQSQLGTSASLLGRVHALLWTEIVSSLHPSGCQFIALVWVRAVCSESAATSQPLHLLLLLHASAQLS